MAAVNQQEDSSVSSSTDAGVLYRLVAGFPEHAGCIPHNVSNGQTLEDHPINRRTHVGGKFPIYVQLISIFSLAGVQSRVDVTINGQYAEVLNKLGWPGTTETYRVHLGVPTGTAPGTATIPLTAAFIPGPEVKISVQ